MASSKLVEWIINPVYTVVTCHHLLLSPVNRNSSKPMSELKFIMWGLQEHNTHLKCTHPVTHKCKSNS